jgi:hypothetical protein
LSLLSALERPVLEWGDRDQGERVGLDADCALGGTIRVREAASTRRPPARGPKPAWISGGHMERTAEPRHRNPVVRFWEARYGGVMLREFVILGVMLWLYKYVRFLIKGRTAEAFENAHRVLHWERWLGLDSESALQRLILPHRTLVVGLNRYYVSIHFVGTVAFLVWAFVRSHVDYQKLRRVLIATTLCSLCIHVLFPLAPPRMMSGFVDTMVRFGPNPYTSSAVKSFTNQFAAMPSLHVGWSIIVAYGVIRIARTPWRWLVVIHPIMTSLAVVLTANHYWLDGVVAAGIVWWSIMFLADPTEAPAQSRQLATVTTA